MHPQKRNRVIFINWEKSLSSAGPISFIRCIKITPKVNILLTWKHMYMDVSQFSCSFFSSPEPNTIFTLSVVNLSFIQMKDRAIFLTGDNRDIVKVYWGLLKMIFSKFTGLIQNILGWLKFKIFSNEKQRLFLRGDNSDIVKIHYRPKTSSIQLSGQIYPNQIFLSKWDENLNKWMTILSKKRENIFSSNLLV